MKDAREKAGVSLKEIAVKTKISVGALEALERDDFSRLPGGIFSRAFIRAYALQVGLDPEVTVRDFLVVLAQSERDAAKTAIRPEVTPEDREFLERQRLAGRILKWVVVLVLIGVIALVVWRAKTWWSGRTTQPQTSSQGR